MKVVAEAGYRRTVREEGQAEGDPSIFLSSEARVV